MLIDFSLRFLLAAGSLHQGDTSVDCRWTPTGTIVPTTFSAGRIFARLHLARGPILQLYTDTGGGMVSLYPAAALRAHLAIDTTHWTSGTAQGVTRAAKISVSDMDPRFPPIPGQDSAALMLVDEQPVPDDEPGVSWDGRLGVAWFINRVWTFDYPSRKLLYNGTAATGPTDSACWVPLGFQTDSAGRRTGVFPRIEAIVDGDPVEFLLDTGARTEVTRSAWQQVEPRMSRYRAASFAGTALFEKWHSRHPEWLVVRHAEVGSDSSSMIRVPAITVGNVTFGPVWFTERPSRSFPTFMSQYTDRPVDGALGGSAWQYVTLVVDYPRARAAVMKAR